MAGWHHRCNGHELGQTFGDGEKQRGLACCNPWGHNQTRLANEQLQQPVSVLGHLGMAPYLSHTESSPVCMHMHTGHVSKCSFLLPLFTGVTFSSTPCSLISNFSWRMGQLLKSESTQTTFQQQPGSQ